MNVTVLRKTENLNPRRVVRDSYLHTYIHTNILLLITYVGMITVCRTMQKEKALLDMVTREVGRDRLVRAQLAR